MADVRNTPEAIQWHEGMLLSPHHFQQLSLRQDALLHYHTQRLDPFHWGVRRFEFDSGLLINGLFRVTDLEAVLPDGQVVSNDSTDAESLEVDLSAEVEDSSQAVLTIHLVLPARSAGAAAADGEFARYISVEGDAVVDENTGEQELRIPRLKPRLSLLVTETPPRRYVSIPLAKVSYTDQRFTITDFIPPSLSVPIHSDVGSACSEVSRRLREKATFLSEKVRGSSATLDATLLLETKVMIQGLVASLPLLEGTLYTGQSHPYGLYLALCSVVGHVAGLGAGLVPPAMVPYQHNDLRNTFSNLRAFILRMLDEGILEAYTAVRFHLQDGFFSLDFQEDWYSRPLILGVRRDASQTEEDLVVWVQGCLIGSTSHEDTMRQNRVLGVPRTEVEQEAGLVGEKGMMFFSLGDDRRYIEPNERLQIFNSADLRGALRPTDIVLYVGNAG